MPKNKVISKETWASLFAIKNYQEFIQEWLALYDSFFACNPHIDERLEDNCLFTLINGLMDKWVVFLQKHPNVEYTNIIYLLENYKGILENELK